MSKERLQRVARDRHGYLRNPGDWDEELARELAREEQLQMDERHREIITLLRDFHAQYDRTPATRIMTRLVAERLGPAKGNSIYLMKLFPGVAVKQGCKVAGLPRPTQCF